MLSIKTPLYVAEISPKNVRGTAVSMSQVQMVKIMLLVKLYFANFALLIYQLTIMVGISFTFIVGSVINWRTMALIGTN